jgi:hypothetical protein
LHLGFASWAPPGRGCLETQAREFPAKKKPGFSKKPGFCASQRTCIPDRVPRLAAFFARNIVHGH